MNTYRILAQSFTTSQRIAKVINAASEAIALRMVSVELDNAGFYVTDIKAI